MSINNSFSFSFHENTPSWLESYHSQMNDSVATKKRLESERAKMQEKMGDTQISQENYDNSLYTIFFSDDRAQHNRIVNKAAIKHWRHKEIKTRDQVASYQNLKAVLSGPGTLSAEPELYEIDQETTYKAPALLAEEDNYSYGMGLDRSCLEVFLTESAKEKALHDYFLGKRQKPAKSESFNFGPPSLNPRLDPALEETVQDIQPFNQLSHDANPLVAKAAKQRIEKS